MMDGTCTNYLDLTALKEVSSAERARAPARAPCLLWILVALQLTYLFGSSTCTDRLKEADRDRLQVSLLQGFRPSCDCYYFDLDCNDGTNRFSLKRRFQRWSYRSF